MGLMNMVRCHFHDYVRLDGTVDLEKVTISLVELTCSGEPFLGWDASWLERFEVLEGTDAKEVLKTERHVARSVGSF